MIFAEYSFKRIIKKSQWSETIIEYLWIELYVNLRLFT
jgi:hypothetical protein